MIKTITPINKNISTHLFNAIFMVFILCTLFDPMDRLLGLKTYLFTACMAYGAIYYITYPGRLKIPLKLIFYVGLMIFIPLFSITHYYFIDGGSLFQGFLLFKSYIFITFSLLIYISKIVHKFFQLLLNFLEFL